MRAVIPSVVVFLAASSAAHADMTPPPFTYISREVVLEFAEPYQGWKFFAVSSDFVRPVSTTAPVALSELLGDNYATRRMGVVVYAVPDDLFAEAGNGVSAKWFEQNRENPRLRHLGIGVLSISTTMADPRERVVEKYRVTLTPTSFDRELDIAGGEIRWWIVDVRGDVLARHRADLVLGVVHPPTLPPLACHTNDSAAGQLNHDIRSIPPRRSAFRLVVSPFRGIPCWLPSPSVTRFGRFAVASPRPRWATCSASVRPNRRTSSPTT